METRRKLTIFVGWKVPSPNYTGRRAVLIVQVVFNPAESTFKTSIYTRVRVFSETLLSIGSRTIESLLVRSSVFPPSATKIQSSQSDFRALSIKWKKKYRLQLSVRYSRWNRLARSFWIDSCSVDTSRSVSSTPTRFPVAWYLKQWKRFFAVRLARPRPRNGVHTIIIDLKTYDGMTIVKEYNKFTVIHIYIYIFTNN